MPLKVKKKTNFCWFNSENRQQPAAIIYESLCFFLLRLISCFVCCYAFLLVCCSGLFSTLDVFLQAQGDFQDLSGVWHYRGFVSAGKNPTINTNPAAHLLTFKFQVTPQCLFYKNDQLVRSHLAHFTRLFFFYFVFTIISFEKIKI